MAHVLGADEDTRYGQARTMEALCGSCAGTRSPHRPSPHGELLEQTQGAFNRRQGEIVRAFVWPKCGYLGFRIELGRSQADGLEGAPAVTYPKEGFRLETPGHGPASPLLFDVAGRVDQDAVEVEQNCLRLEAFHGEQSSMQFSIR